MGEGEAGRVNAGFSQEDLQEFGSVIKKDRKNIKSERKNGGNMRLDKFLKVSRLIKRRTLAKEVADQGRITVNGNQAKASTDIKIGDELSIRFGQKMVTVKVNDLKEVTKKEDAGDMYTVLKEEKVSE